MNFILDAMSSRPQAETMSKLARVTAAVLFVAALALVWVRFGTSAALGVAFTVLSYGFVSVMRTAADEIRRYERDQRPDLHV
jgi:hypothetical protein